MNLRNKLIIAFCVMVFLPMLLFAIVMITVGSKQLKDIEMHERKSNVSEEQMMNEDATLDETSDATSDATGEVTNGQQMIMPEVRQFLKFMYVSITLILLLTAMLLMIWIYSEFNVPITNLKKATRNIAEGNLNFTLDITGDDEISDLCRDFEEMRKRLLESTKEKMEYDRQSKELISNISHDLKTPITAIKGYVEGIMDGVADTPEKMDRYIHTIYYKANDLDRLINELTFYSKIDTNRIPYTFDRINVQGFFEDCCEELKMDLEEKNFSFKYENSVEPDVLVIADAEQIRRVIINIIGNSLKYNDKSEGYVSLRVKDVGDFIQVELEDNGKGIQAKELPYIFDRFYRTDTSRNSTTGGSGIGLSIVKKIIEDHGGKIWASSVEGTGTTMFFVLRKYQEVPV